MKNSFPFVPLVLGSLCLFGLTVYFSQSHMASPRKPPILVTKTNQDPLHLVFTGDIMLDRNVALHAQAFGDESLFASVRQMFTEADATVINLEGTITTNQSISIADNSRLQFTFAPGFAVFLKNSGITAASLSNNHTFDFGRSGYESTKAFLAQAGIFSFGSPNNIDTLSTKIIVKGKTMCLIGYEGFVNADTSPIVTEIMTVRPLCDLVVATMHAGEEYFEGHTGQQQNAAHAFIDAGADVVIGTHPHVVEPLELYKGKAIFYSLGNFMFDQNFSFETTHGLAVVLEWSDTETRYTLIPITIKDEEASFSNTEDSTQTLSALIDADLKENIKSSIQQTSAFTVM